MILLRISIQVYSLSGVMTPWYTWNTAKVGIKHQSINQAINQSVV